MITVDLSRLTGWDFHQIEKAMAHRLAAAHQILEEGTGAGGETTGWLRWPKECPAGELDKIQQAAAQICRDSQVLVVIGIGGSYLGAKAAIDLLGGNGPEKTQVIFAGNTLSSDEMAALLAQLENKSFSVNVISKSGTTTEPAVAFRFLRQYLEERYGEEADRRIYVTTDPQKGALRALARAQQWTSFSVPGSIGGRYSVLTAVGLLPMAVAGIDINRVLAGAREEMEQLSRRSMENPAWQYAAARNLMYEAGKKVELLAYYEPTFRFMAEWWKQLFGESEGKQGKGLFPASVEYTADLHSMGQYVQDGQRILMETMVSFQNSGTSLSLPYRADDGDGLNYLAGRTLEELRTQAMAGAAIAHEDGGVPNIQIQVPSRNPESYGALVYFFELSCGLSGYLMGVNPFDQPGVEAYKKNMFTLLWKPGYEALQQTLKNRSKSRKKAGKRNILPNVAKVD